MNVPLQGSNLIEASAGTGKTYSLALLVLRLVVEENVPLERILMVTFTRDATAELEDRIRQFIRQAYNHSLGNTIVNKEIIAVVDNLGKEKACQQLGKAVESLDILSVMTIHSFCEKSLTAFPFETGQPFRFEVVEEIGRLREQVVNKYWREKVTTLKRELFEEFSKTLNRKAIDEVLRKALEGREYIAVEDDEADVLQEIKDSEQAIIEAQEAFDNHFKNNYEEIIQKLKGELRTKGFIQRHGNSWEALRDEFFARFKKKDTTQFLQSFHKEKELYEVIELKEKARNDFIVTYASAVFAQAIKELKQKVANLKAQKQVIDYDDQINFLHKAVMEGTAQEVLSEQYDAVFIDEFQDTDKKQFEIFHTLYSDKILFYIGDPKQSIYGWRKADMGTYKKARNGVKNVYSMNVNYRSTPSYIDGLNGFFSSNNPFNDEEITYTEVNCPDNSKDSFTHNGSPIQNPLEFYKVRNEDHIKTFTANSIAELITDQGYKIDGRELTFSDITVIVRTNDQVKKMKDELSKLNIPSVTVNDFKVLQSEETDFVRHVMVAAHRPSRKNINRVLLSSATNIRIRSLVETDEHVHLENFIQLKELWDSHGIYAMLSQFIVVYNVRHHCLIMGTQGQRILTNIQHIAEVLHRYEYQNKETPTELIEWFSKSSNESSEEYEQRIESQDNAVKITTIHKSKGLTFGIVFAPFLDLKPWGGNNIPTICDFRDEDGVHKFTHQPTDKQVELYRLQEDQENRRLIYVALTRAKYMNTVIVSNDESCLNEFNLPTFKEVDEEMATRLREPLKIDSATSFAAKPAPNLLVKNQFGIHSYSALSRAHYSFPFESEVLGDEKSYDQFIFQDLARGAKVGTAVHSIFERLDFANPSGWNQTILGASKYYPNIIKQPNGSEGELGNLYHFAQMVEHVMYANIELNGTTFSLAQVGKSQMLPELEFYFAIDRVNKTEIDRYLGEDAKLSGEADLQGLMTGFVDLLFEHKGKYYIADWKTNHLGNSVEHYNIQGVEQAMLGSNYHLQYMIYTIAVVRWLRHRIKDFSYEKHFGGIIYLFLRGIRKGESSGIYVNRPKEEDILNLDKAFHSSQG